MRRHSFPTLPHLVFAAMMLHGGLAQAKVAQVYLVQNSGWMEPFFTDPKSELRPLLQALITDTRITGAEVLIASFNQQGAIPGEDSPRLLYRGTVDELSTVTKVIAALNLPQKPNGRFADADFEGALRNTLDTLLQRRPAVIWMITNNKNDPNNSPDVQLHTQAFYRLLREQVAITLVVAYPVAMPTKGQHYQEGGLMIYGLAYGTSADAVLNQLLKRDSLRRRFNNPPVRLKPLRHQVLSFEPQHVLTPRVRAVLQQGTLILRGIEAQSSEVVIQGRLRSTYYPQEIRAARVAIALSSGGGPDKADWLQGEIEPALVTNLSPGGSIEDIRIRIHLPRFSVWSLDTLFAEGYGARATLMISLTAQELVLSQRFQEQMDHIFGLGQLPEIFLPGASDSTSETSIPVLLQVNYPAWPLAVLMLLAILALIALAILVTALNRERRFIIELEGNRLAVAIRPFRTQPVRSPEGRPVAEITGTLFGKPRLKRLEQKTRVEIR